MKKLKRVSNSYNYYW